MTNTAAGHMMVQDWQETTKTNTPDSSFQVDSLAQSGINQRYY